MVITINYTSSRSEVWHWYKKMWQRRLWKYHVAIICALFLSSLISGAVRSVDDIPFLIVPLLIGLAAIGFMVLYPQLMFKPKERIMTLDRQGIRTMIGKESGEVDWREINSIESDNNCIFITRKNGNAFIVPGRAFASASDRSHFINSIREWHGTSTQQSV